MKISTDTEEEWNVTPTKKESYIMNKNIYICGKKKFPGQVKKAIKIKEFWRSMQFV